MSLYLAISAVFPIFTYMVIGYLLNRRKKLNSGTISQVNSIIYSYCFPVVMFNGIYQTDLGKSFNISFILSLILIILLLTIMFLVILPRRFKDKAILGSMIQGMVRGNAVLFALPVVSIISGSENTGLISLCLATVVPFYNILCVIILEKYRGHSLSVAKITLSIVKNPVIIGIIAGIAFNLTGLKLPQFSKGVISSIASLATPIALMMLGAELHFSDTKKYRTELTIVSLVKLIIMPTIFILVVKFLGFGKYEVTAAMAISSVPTAVSSYVMAKEMQAHEVLAGQIVAVTTSLSILTVFLWVLILLNIGWIG